jgi:twinkle protein
MILTPESLKDTFMSYKGGSGLSTGLSVLDGNLMPQKGYLMVVSGYAGAGKSEFVDAMLQNMGLLHNWKSLLYSPENFPVEDHMQKLSERYVGKRWQKMTQKEKQQAYALINRYFNWVQPDVLINIHQMLDMASSLADSGKLQCLVIDPWNQMSHKRRDRVDEYLSDALAHILHFARSKGILVIIVAHPKNPTKGKDGKLPIPGMYDINEGAMWRNKADYGVMIHRPDYQKIIDPFGDYLTNVDVLVQKCKQKWMGNTGCYNMAYHVPTGRYRGKLETSFDLPVEHRVPF